jgi:hypothetical protein
MYNFMVYYSESKTEQVKMIVYDTDECREAGLNIESVCFASGTLNITLQNRNYARLDGLDFRLYNGHLPIQTNVTELTLNPNRNKLVSLITGVSNVTYVEVIPHVQKDNKDIICSERKAASEVTGC